MPEQLTKHPEVTLQVLRSAGATCGEGAPQSILTKCPSQRFCKLPGGEVCVYGIPEARAMTQFTAADWQAVHGTLQSEAQNQASVLDGTAILIGAVGAIVGAVLAALALRLKNRWS
ncbi:hypothetical protein [Piscinibacter defluvii]|uniref:hypothetical protein n=1 Tax=Piscinibacter defluvii TaxID=1796922 RepID=UPI000FDE707E|nr:hypothetical protein [Piscinibacter defluvii]